MLDAVHYLCFCKSYFNPIDAQNIAHGEPFMLVQDLTASTPKSESGCNVAPRSIQETTSLTSGWQSTSDGFCATHQMMRS